MIKTAILIGYACMILIVFVGITFVCEFDPPWMLWVCYMPLAFAAYSFWQDYRLAVRIQRSDAKLLAERNKETNATQTGEANEPTTS